MHPAENNVSEKQGQFNEMPSSPRSPDEFIDSFEASFAGFLPGDFLRSLEDLIARASHTCDLKLEAAGDDFEAVGFDVSRIGEHGNSLV